MTCLVAVMNARGVALAADSAVSLGDCRKVYDTAEKLFRIAPDIPVGIMVFGNAEMMGIPWETIAKGFAQKLDGRRFDTLKEYATNLLSFIEGSNGLFTVERQAAFVKNGAEIIWSICLQNSVGSGRTSGASEKLSRLRKTVDDALTMCKEDPALQGLPDDYGELIVKTYATELNDAMKEVFEGLDLTEPDRAALLDLAAAYFTRQDRTVLASGVVIAGMGETEPLPGVLEYSIGTIAAGRLRYASIDESWVNLACESMILPFAQDSTIDMIVTGLHPEVRARILSDASRLFSDAKNDGKLDQRMKAFEECLDMDAAMRYAPLQAAVSALPRRDLARMAETLVNLTEFAKRMSVDEDESVGGPIDVAVLSKADRFTWVRHKDLVQEIGRGSG